MDHPMISPKDTKARDRWTAKVNVRNDFDGPATIRLQQQYKDHHDHESGFQPDTPSGELTTPDMTIGFRSGGGKNRWYCEVEYGAERYRSELKDNDTPTNRHDDGKTITHFVDESYLTIHDASGKELKKIKMIKVDTP